MGQPHNADDQYQLDPTQPAGSQDDPWTIVIFVSIISAIAIFIIVILYCKRRDDNRTAAETTNYTLIHIPMSERKEGEETSEPQKEEEVENKE